MKVLLGAAVALGRFTVTAKVTLTADTIAAVTAGDPATGAPAGPGNTATVPQLLYQAIGSSSLRAFTDGQDNVGTPRCRTSR